MGRPIFGLLDPDDAERGPAPPDRSRGEHVAGVDRDAPGPPRRRQLSDLRLQGERPHRRPAHRGGRVVLRLASERFQAWETERRLRAIVEHSADAVLVYGSDLHVAYASPSAKGFLGELDGTLVDHVTRRTP